MKSKDALFNDFLSERIEDQTLLSVVGGQEWKPTRKDRHGTNNAHTEGDEGDCDLDDVHTVWHMDEIYAPPGG